MKTLVLLIAMSLLGSCHKEEKKGKRHGAKSGPVPVRVVTTKKEEIPRIAVVGAVLTGQKQADIYPKFTGRIAEILVKEGEAVKVGQTLFRIDRSDPGESFLSAPVQSPFSGWLGRWHVTGIGQQVTQNEPVVTILDDRVLKAEVMLATEDWQGVGLDTKVSAEVSGVTRQGRVIAVARAADAATGRGSVTVEIENPERDWRAGVLADLTFYTNPKQRLALSTSALVITDQGAFVYTVTDTTAKRAAVTFTLSDHDQAEILSGVSEGERVVVVGGNLVSDGAEVKIVE